MRAIYRDIALNSSRSMLALASVLAMLVVGRLATLDSYGVWTACGLAALLLAVVLRLGVTETVIILVPVMFYFPGNVNVNLSAADFLVPLLALQALAARVRTPRLAALYGWLLLGSMLVSATFAGLGASAPTNSSLVATVKVAICVVFLWLLSARLKQADRTRIVTIWVAVATIISAGTVVQLLGLTALGRSYGGVRAAGSFEDPNLFGVYLVISLALAFSSHNHGGRSLRALEVGLMLVAATMTGSRTALVAICLMAALGLVVTRTCGVRTAFAVGALLLGAVVLSGQMSQFALGAEPAFSRPFSIIQGAGGDVRLELWSGAVAQWSAHPVFGLGPGSFQGSGGLVAHSTYLTFLSEGGLLGLLAFASLPVVLAVRLFRRRRLGAHHQALLVALIGLMVEMAALNLQNVRFVWAFFALAVWAADDSEPPSPIVLVQPLRR